MRVWFMAIAVLCVWGEPTQAQETCDQQSAKKSIQDIIAHHRGQGVDLVDPGDRFSCVFDHAPVTGGVDLSGVQPFFAGPESSVPTAQLQSCFEETKSSEKVTNAVLIYRRMLCASTKPQDRDPAYMRKISDSFATSNKKYLEDPAKLDLILGELKARAAERAEQMKCKTGVKVNFDFQSNGVMSAIATESDARAARPPDPVETEAQRDSTEKADAQIMDGFADETVASRKARKYLSEYARKVYPQKASEFQNGTLDHYRANGIYYCGAPVWNGSLQRSVAESSSINELAVDFNDLKQPNAWKISDSDADKMLAMIEQSPQFSTIKNCLSDIQTIEVQSSASKLRNDEEKMMEIYKTYPELKSQAPSRWDYYALSFARAEQMQFKLVKRLMDKYKMDPRVTKVRPILGDHNSGATGPCFYKLSPVGKKFAVVPITKMLDDKHFDSEIAQAQSARIVIRFGGKCKTEFKSLGNQELGASMSTPPCVGFKYSCK